MVIDKEDIFALAACVEVADPGDGDWKEGGDMSPEALHVRAHAVIQMLERESRKSPVGAVIIVPTLS